MKNSFFAYKNSFFAYKNSFFAYKNSFFAYKNSFFKRLSLGFTGVTEWLKYLNLLKFLNSSVCEEICLVFWFLFGWSGEKFESRKKPKGKKNRPNEKNKKTKKKKKKTH
jgi:hypothetical protein